MKSIQIEKKIWKELTNIKVDKDYRTLGDVIADLLRGRFKKEVKK